MIWDMWRERNNIVFRCMKRDLVRFGPWGDFMSLFGLSLVGFSFGACFLGWPCVLSFFFSIKAVVSIK